MELGVRDKVTLVTGGSKGIGLACARAFLGEGARVAIASRNPENLEAARRSLNANSERLLLVTADLVQAENASTMLRQVLAQFGPVDILINSAGAARRSLPEDVDAAAWHAAMDAKYFTYIHSMDAVIRGMAARHRGVVINVIGMGGKVPTPIHLPGGAANAALMAATVGLAKAYACKGVRVIGINPGFTMTERLKEGLRLEARAQRMSAEEVLARGQAMVPLGRYAAPEEVADLALFLASERASYLTGIIIPMHGGANAAI
jgi:NAD(P)-dependent dehydrogenase (short-subunit alcohol dehydrogenase family)